MVRYGASSRPAIDEVGWILDKPVGGLAAVE